MLAFLAAVALLCFSACAHDVEALREDAHQRSAANREQALRRALRDHSLVRVELPMRVIEPWSQPERGSSQPLVRRTAPDRGLRGEQLIQVDTELRLVLQTCIDDDDCGCLMVEYVPAHDRSGRLVILRVRAVKHTRVVKQAGRCPMGCGMKVEPLNTMFILPSDDVRLIDVIYHLYRVEVTCEHPDPMP